MMSTTTLIILIGIPCVIIGALAARKGYNFFIWFLIGGLSFIGLIVGLIVLGFLPYANRATAPEEQARLRKKGNIIGAVVAVICLVLFAVTAISNYIVATQRQKTHQTVETMKKLTTAIGSYQVDNNHFPLQRTEGVLSEEILPSSYAADDRGVFQDAWGSSFRYSSDGESYKLISYGKDQKEGKVSSFGEDIIFSNGRLVAPEYLVR